MFISSLFKKLLLLFIWLYQKLISPFLGANCRFYPSCSNYASQVLNKYELIGAIRKITVRLSKCHPGNPGGIDLP